MPSRSRLGTKLGVDTVKSGVLERVVVSSNIELVGKIRGVEVALTIPCSYYRFRS